MRIRRSEAMTFRAIIVGTLLSVTPWQTVERAWADAPFISDGEDRIASRNGAFFAVPSHDRRSTITYRVVSGRKAERVWTRAGWNEVAYLSDDGEYLVVGYPGVNLLELDYKPDVVMLSFFHRAKTVAVVRLNEIIQDRAHLSRSVSHFAWGMFAGFVAPHHFAVDTIENRRLVYDVSSGAQISAGASPSGAN